METLAVERHVQAHGFAVGRDTQTHGVLADHQDSEGQCAGPDGRHADTDGLLQEGRVGGRRVDSAIGQHAGEERANDAAQTVDAECVQAVVIVEALLDPGSAEVAGCAAGETDHQRALRRDVSRGWRDAHQAAHRARGHAQHSWLLVLDPIDGHPDERCARRRDLRVEQGGGGHTVGHPCGAIFSVP